MLPSSLGRELKAFTTMAILFLYFPVVTSAADPPTLLAKVSGIASGDTLTISDETKAYTVRLYGVRCPKKDRPWGPEAREFMTETVFGKRVEVRFVSDFPGDRSSVIITSQGQVLNEELLKRGLAWVNAPACRQPICSRWAELESQAKAVKKGLWGHPRPERSWEGKKKSRPKAPQSD